MDVGGLLNGNEGVNSAAFDRSTSTDDVQRYVTNIMEGYLYLLILNCNFYWKREEWFQLL